MTFIFNSVKAHNFKWSDVTSEWDLLRRPVDSSVSLHENPDRLAVGNRNTVNSAIHIDTCTQNTHSVYSHKREHGHNGCGDEELSGQNQIHLKKHIQTKETLHPAVSRHSIHPTPAPTPIMSHISSFPNVWHKQKHFNTWLCMKYQITSI